jgi:hypothetical protein
VGDRLGGRGVVSIGVGTVFGLSATAQHNDPANACTTTPCSKASIDANSKARTFADVSTATFVVGAAGLALGAFLWFGDHGEGPGKTAIHVVPDASWGRAGVSVNSAF